MFRFEAFTDEISDLCLENCPGEYKKALWMWSLPRKELSEIQFHMKFGIGRIRNDPGMMHDLYGERHI